MNRRLFLAAAAVLPLVAAISLATGIALSLPVLAQDHASHGDHAAAASMATVQASNVAGQVTRVDARAGKITIKHGPIKEFGLEDGHTMVFRAQDPELVKAVKTGDKVKFDAERVNGEYTVTKIQKAT